MRGLSNAAGACGRQAVKSDVPLPGDARRRRWNLVTSG
jgi:hypothetical protein